MILAISFWLLSTPCPFLLPPVDEPISRGFDISAGLAGHWGADFDVGWSTPIHASGNGRVTFAGEVNNRLSVSLDLGGGLVSTVSHLDNTLVTVGTRVSRGQTLGWASGEDHNGKVHWSVRIDGRYLDPAPWIKCHFPFTDALTLDPVSKALLPYYGVDDRRHSGRNIRPTALGSSNHRRSRVVPTGSGEGYLHPRRYALAETGTDHHRSASV